LTRELPHWLSLVQPVTYEIKVPGVIRADRLEWGSDLKVVVEGESTGQPVTRLTGEFDQAALHGLLRRLYSIGLPLISVLCFGHQSGADDE
jgi:hypothetical protein